jgi:predicted dithiol-disulfide oxidoreductase (DUF899 family)
VSRTSIDVIAAYKKRMGRSFPWVSSAGSDFNFDFGVSFRENELAAGAEHNFRPYRVDAADLPHGGTTDATRQARTVSGIPRVPRARRRHDR